jgi:hypothetical protein
MDRALLNKYFQSKQSLSTNLCVPYRNLCKSALVVRAMEKIYSPIYEVSEQDFFVYSPLLTFIVLFTYESDDQVESAQAQVNDSSLSQPSPWDSAKEIIQSLLRELNLEHSTIFDALENVGEFFDLESKILTSKQITYEDVIRISELRSCDFRLLHSVLIQMLGKLHRQEIFDILLPREVLIEFNDDICSYKDDVAAGNYNTYWMFERLFGKEEAHHYLKAEIDRYYNLFYERLKLVSEKEQELFSMQFTRWWKRFPFLSSAELIRKTALEGTYLNA